jgi:hypothetical protein
VKYKECANMLAGKAEISGGRAMDHAGVLRALLETGRVEDYCWDIDSTKGKLKYGHIKLGMDILEHCAGSNR